MTQTEVMMSDFSCPVTLTQLLNAGVGLIISSVTVSDLLLQYNRPFHNFLNGFLSFIRFLFTLKLWYLPLFPKDKYTHQAL